MICACGRKTLKVDEIEEALADCGGTLNTEMSGNSVKGFTYVVTGDNADDLVDKEYTRDATNLLLYGDTGDVTYGQYQVTKAVGAVLEVQALLEGENDEFDFENTLSIICDGKTFEYRDWYVSATVDQTADSIEISVTSGS